MNIAETVAQATTALDFETPLRSDDPRWTDFTPARGDWAMQKIKKLFDRQVGQQRLHVVFASHRGAGKTTELNRLASNLSERYYPIYFEANIEMDAVRFEMEDLLLVIARAIEQKMREMGRPLDNALLAGVEKWFSEVVLVDDQLKKFLLGVKAEAKAEGGIPFFAKLMTSVSSSLQIESTHRESIKSTLKKFPGTLMKYVNRLLAAANEELATTGKQLLLVIDNMDRYEPRVIDELLVQSADRFKALDCHLIVTPPIGLVLRPKSQMLDSVFRCETMPTVSLRKKKDSYASFSGPGRDLMLDALGKRINVNKLVPDTSAQNRLVSASGGAIRELLELAQDATLEANGDIITPDDVDRVLSRRRQRLRDRIDANGWWAVLNRIASRKRLDEEDACFEVLFQRLAFQYNGEMWYDVHPLISELPDFVADTKSHAPYSPTRTAQGKKRL